MNATPKQIIFLSATNKNAVILRLARESGEPKDPSSFFLSLIAILRRAVNRAIDKNSVILSEATQRLPPGWFAAKDPSSVSFEENDPLPTSNVFSRHAQSAPEARHNLAQRGSAGYAIDEKQSAIGAAQSFDSNALDGKKKSVILSPSRRTQDPSWFLLSVVVIFRRALNATWRNLSLQGPWRPRQFVDRFSATNKPSAICSMSEKRFLSNEKTSVILSEAKDPSFFSLSPAAILRVAFAAVPQRFSFSACRPSFSAPPCLRGKSLFAGAYQ